MLKEDENVAMFAIGVDPKEKIQGFIRRIEKDGKGKVKFDILSDPGHKIIDAYGLMDTQYIGSSNEGIPHPAIYLLDENRKIGWAQIESNYRVRPPLSEVRMELDKFKARLETAKKEFGKKK